MSNDPLKDVRTHNLMLLLGTNPLPNYVASKMLTIPESRLHLMVTPRIKEAKLHERLLSLLGRNPFDRSLYFSVDPSDPEGIEEKVRNRISRFDGPWGLHYTGGTKIMAVHAYRGVESALAQKKEEGRFTYLDASKRKLIVDPFGGFSHQEIDIALPDSMFLWQLIYLHGKPEESVEKLKWDEYEEGALENRDLGQKPHHLPFRPDIGEHLKNAFLDPDKVAEMMQWNTTMSSLRKEEASDFKLPECIGGNLGRKTIQELAEETGRDANQIQHWLRGTWLEHFVLGQIMLLKEECGITDHALGFETLLWKDGSESEKHETDVGVMIGHRFFYISVSKQTNKKECKNRLFEAFVRAHQLGGDHAEASIISFHKQPGILEREIRDERHVHVKAFGPDDLRDSGIFRRRLKEWFLKRGTEGT